MDAAVLDLAAGGSSCCKPKERGMASVRDEALVLCFCQFTGRAAAMAAVWQPLIAGLPAFKTTAGIAHGCCSAVIAQPGASSTGLGEALRAGAVAWQLQCCASGSGGPGTAWLYLPLPMLRALAACKGLQAEPPGPLPARPRAPSSSCAFAFTAVWLRCASRSMLSCSWFCGKAHEHATGAHLLKSKP